jgi:hypothetical protein
MAFSKQTDVAKVAQQSTVKQLLDLDKIPWYRKKNLRRLYLCLIPAVLGVEMTSGYDGSILNGLQAVASWNAYFNNPNGAILGVITAAFSIGAVLALPIVPFVSVCSDILLVGSDVLHRSTIASAESTVLPLAPLSS